MDLPSNKWVIFLIVITLATNATILVCTLAYCTILKIEPNSVLLTAIIALVNYILGAISGMLVKTSPTQTTTQVSVQDQPTVVPADPEPKK